MLHLRKQRDRALHEDVALASSRIAEESRNVAQTAREELRELSREARDQASSKAEKARKATAARLAEAAEALEPERKRRRKLPWLAAGIAGGLTALKLTKRNHQAASPS